MDKQMCEALNRVCYSDPPALWAQTYKALS